MIGKALKQYVVEEVLGKGWLRLSADEQNRRATRQPQLLIS